MRLDPDTSKAGAAAAGQQGVKKDSGVNTGMFSTRNGLCSLS